jgi:hypothetical protein
MRCAATLLALACLTAACHNGGSGGSPYLFIWSGDQRRIDSDFLAVVNADRSSSKYGQIVSTVPVKSTANQPHHTEYEFPKDGLLFGSGWASGRVYLFDLTAPTSPRVVTQFSERDGYNYAHSFARLQNGHVLATFQSQSQGYAPPGGLVELTETGQVVRSASAADGTVSRDVVWPYSLAVIPDIDRIITTDTPMGLPDWATLPPGSWPFSKVADQATWHVQIWRLSELRPLMTIALPEDAGQHHLYPGEPRVLSDGSVYVNTFGCGLFRLRDLTGHPTASLVHTFPGKLTPDMEHICSVPVVIGHFWIQTVATLPGLIALDISDPEKPVEVSRVIFGQSFHMPHWLAADRRGDRVVATGAEMDWTLIVDVDPKSGALKVDDRFRSAGSRLPGIRTNNVVVHAALFGPR